VARGHCASHVPVRRGRLASSEAVGPAVYRVRVTGEQSSIFISYSHEDKELARVLARALDDLGLRVWTDEGELKVGDSLIERIATAIAEIDFFLALVSEASRGSNWCRKELALAVTGELRARGRESAAGARRQRADVRSAGRRLLPRARRDECGGSRREGGRLIEVKADGRAGAREAGGRQAGGECRQRLSEDERYAVALPAGPRNRHRSLEGQLASAQGIRRGLGARS
jgi:hypothetical protein